MKYMRTKEGIYEDAGISALGFRNALYKGISLPLDALTEEDDKIIEEADTIEELCDCFVRWKDELYKKAEVSIFDIMGVQSLLIGIYKHISKAKRGFKYRTTEKLYGAIWTDKGLKYVAKMNEKGELELL